MGKIAWSNEQDTTLGEVVVREVKSGKQLKEAFSTAADEINILFDTNRNTGSVCTRWYAEVARNFGSLIKGVNTVKNYTKINVWSQAEDDLLAYTLFTYFKNNKTQKAAFEFVSERLNRTFDATGARWAVLTKGRYGELYRSLKSGEEVNFVPSPLDKKAETEVHSEVVQAVKTGQPINKMLNQISSYLNSIENEKAILTLENKDLKNQLIQTRTQIMDYDELKANVEALQTQLTQRTQELIKLESDFKSLEDDNKTYLRLVDKARKLTLEEESGEIESHSIKFKMDCNGNLERL